MWHWPKIELSMDVLESETSSSSDELELTINTAYASKYDKWRSKEEYQKRGYCWVVGTDLYCVEIILKKFCSQCYRSAAICAFISSKLSE